MLESLNSYIAKACRGNREQFLAKHAQPAFVVDPFAERSGQNKFQTVTGGVGEGTVTSVARVRKREGKNAFAMMITLGRAPNNDIEIPAPDVSKFHAYMRQGDDGEWRITDAGSRFGTFVGAQRLGKDESASVAPGAQVKLGSVVMTFHDPSSFYDYLTGAAAQ